MPRTHVYAYHMRADVCGGQKQELDPWRWSYAVVNCPVWVLGPELWYSAGVGKGLHHLAAISLDISYGLLNEIVRSFVS